MICNSVIDKIDKNIVESKEYLNSARVSLDMFCNALAILSTDVDNSNKVLSICAEVSERVVDITDINKQLDGLYSDIGALKEHTQWLDEKFDTLNTPE